MLSAFLSAVITALFWLVIYGLWGELFYAQPPEDEDLEQKEERDRVEEQELLIDLLRSVNIIEIRTDRREEINNILRNPDTSRRVLTDLGVAENRTATQNDEKQTVNGDNWLCDNRPWGFAVVQFCLCWGLTSILSLILIPLAAVAISFVATTAIIAVLSCVVVEENMRVGVKRFGKQCKGFLEPGLQFLWLPGVIEKPEIVTLQDFVWGPKLGTPTAEQFHLNGALGTNDNPTPGEFNVYLHGAWPLKIIVLITLRVRRSTKYALWRFLNAYASEEEIGEQIAGVSLSFLTTYAREVERETERQPADNTFDQAVASLLKYLNRMPEISGKILLAMQQLGRNRLAGLLPVSVAIASVTPGVEFLQLRQKLDHAHMDRLGQQIDAEGTKKRLELMYSMLEKIPEEEKQRLLVELERLYTQQTFARDKSGVETLIHALGLSQSRQATE